MVVLRIRRCWGWVGKDATEHLLNGILSDEGKGLHELFAQKLSKAAF
jgi:hypothetical protein